MNDNGSDDDSVDIDVEPPNRDGATVDSMIPQDIQELAKLSHYCVIARWEYRLELLIRYKNAYMAAHRNGLKPPALPTKQDFLLSDDPNRAEIESSFEYLIWGNHDDSVQSLYKCLVPLLDEQHQIEVSLQSLVDSLSREAGALESTSFDHEETPANSNMSSEQLEIQLLKQQLLKRTQGQIRATLEGISDRLGKIKEKHTTLRGTLLTLAEKGNETAGTGVSYSDDAKDRINSSTPKLTPPQARNIANAKPDPAFRQHLLDKKEITKHKEKLEELRRFVMDLQNSAQIYQKFDPRTHAEQKEEQDKKIKATVDAILRWTPGVTVESLGQVNGRLAFPPSRGCETSADQPILGAIICRILTIISDSSLSLWSEQVLPSEENKGRGRRIDFVVDVHKEFLKVLFPEMLGKVIEVKTVDENDAIRLDTNKRKGREQVLGHQAKQLYCSSTLGGIGQNDIAWGIVGSLRSVQVLKMELERDGADNLALRFRQTEQVPFLDEGANGDGFVLLASALLHHRTNSPFGTSKKLSLEDTTAKDRCKIQSVLGSGGFAHVVKLDDNEFMKIPRSHRMEKSLRKECSILQKLNEDDNPAIPRTRSWGVSEVKLAIRNEISEMTVLRLTGIVGHSLNSGLVISEQRLHCVIQKVYVALEYAHDKGIFHMDVRPSNIIVKWNENDWDVLLVDWGCGMFQDQRIKEKGFVGCIPYAHDILLQAHGVLKPIAAFDFASLGYTWYHAVKKVLDWRFNQHVVDEVGLKIRESAMASFFQDIGKDTAAMVPKVRDCFTVRPPDVNVSSDHIMDQ